MDKYADLLDYWAEQKKIIEGLKTEGLIDDHKYEKLREVLTAALDPEYGLQQRSTINKITEKLDEKKVNYSIAFVDVQNQTGLNGALSHDGSTEHTKRMIHKIIKPEVEKHGGKYFRNGGDEFIAIMPGKTENQTKEIFKKIKHDVDTKIKNGIDLVKNIDLTEVPYKKLDNAPLGAGSIDFGVSNRNHFRTFSDAASMASYKVFKKKNEVFINKLEIRQNEIGEDWSKAIETAKKDLAYAIGNIKHLEKGDVQTEADKIRHSDYRDAKSNADVVAEPVAAYQYTCEIVSSIQEITAFDKKGSLNISEKDVNAIIDQYAQKEAGFIKSAGVTDQFHTVERERTGQKLWQNMTAEEKKAEVTVRIIEDLKVAREEIKGKNPADYLLDRALDPLDPMRDMYRVVLKNMGAEITDGKIKLPENMLTESMDVSPKKVSWDPQADKKNVEKNVLDLVAYAKSLQVPEDIIEKAVPGWTELLIKGINTRKEDHGAIKKTIDDYHDKYIKKSPLKEPPKGPDKGRDIGMDL